MERRLGATFAFRLGLTQTRIHTLPMSRLRTQRVHRLKRRIHQWNVNRIDQIGWLAVRGLKGTFADNCKRVSELVGRGM